MKRFVVAMVLGMSAWVFTPSCQAHDSLEQGLLKQAPKLIKYFKEHGYKNVGVLKFLVSRDGKPFSDNVGTFNNLAARRLELALTLANDPRNPIGIVDNANEIARTITGANHLSTEGRQKLFTGKYPLAWGKNTVDADAFVTGTAEMSHDRRTLIMSLFGFDRTTAKLVPLGSDFQVANATDRLSEMGESFSLRGLFPDEPETVTKKPAPKTYETKTYETKAYETKAYETKAYDTKVYEEKAYQEAVNVYEQKTQHPVQQAGQPVTLEVRYAGRKIPFEIKGGRAFIPEPNQGQTVEFFLSRDRSQQRYGVVLKVNGENTLDKQRLPDIACRQWVLGGGEGPWIINGFQIGNNVRETFRVASLTESKQREVNYGHDVGTVTMTVFREQTVKAKPKLYDEQDQYQTIVKNTPEVHERPKNYHALKAQLLEDANRGATRGLILAGNRVQSDVQVVTFVADPTPIMSVTIVYYRR